MKNRFKIAILLVSGALAMASCEGPMGPTGADGAKGDKGDKGDPGTTLACAECHNNNAAGTAFSLPSGVHQHMQWEKMPHMPIVPVACSAIQARDFSSM